MFDISSTTGQLTLRQSLDYESMHQVQVTVTARDRGTNPHQATLSITVDIRDVNDNAPVFSKPEYSFGVSESLPIGNSFARVNATDRDAGNGKIFF